MSKAVVCVTGASGFIASRIIHQLRETGNYNVRVTVRNPSDQKKTEFLRSYGDVEIFGADLLKEGSFDQAFSGANFVIHTASPVIQNSTDPENDLYKPAIFGTQNVLNSCLKNGVKRVVITSSMAAICGSQRTRDPKHIWVEEDWNSDALIRQNSSPYSISKTHAELSAWDFVSKNPSLELVTINPSFVLGPPVYDRCDANSLARPKAIIEGTLNPIPNSMFGTVDVRTVAEAHIKALEIPKANQRFILSNVEQSTILELAQITKKLYPQYPVCTELAQGVVPLVSNKFSSDNSRAKERLGVHFYTLEESLKDMFEQMIKLGMVKKIE